MAKGSVWPGIHVFGKYVCDQCGLGFLHDLPIGFAVDHPMAISEKDGMLFNATDGPGWIHAPLMEAYRSAVTDEVLVERIVHRDFDRVVILNTLDYLYGHVLLKLYNAQYYMDRHPDVGLILLLPRMFRWLVPEGVARYVSKRGLYRQDAA